ncbi:MAG: methionyl-tRNA formyltransferase [Emergencia sp.]
MKVVFMGTPDFAVPVLERIIADGHETGYVVTQPDKARNRGKKIQFTPVKEAALSHGIEVLQPEKIRQSSQTIEKIRAYGPDIIVVVAYGQIIQKELLEMPRFGCVNVHASLLPKLRGASPIQHAILQGEEETGVTIMQMGEGLDTGDMLSKASVKIGDMNCEELHDRLAAMGAELLSETLPRIERGEILPEKQDDSISTYAGMISKQDGKIDFLRTPREIERQIRAFDPWPGAFCRYREQTMKLWQAQVLKEDTSGQGSCCGAEDGQKECVPGQILNVSDDGIDICCGGGVLRAVQIQMPGKKRVAVKDFLRGNRIEKGEILG